MPSASRLRRLLLKGLALCPLWRSPAHAQPRPLMLATAWREGLPLQDYHVSEKFDGLRGYWDGRQLWTRGGHAVQAPGWFTDGWPTVALDGELWAGHGRFETAVSTARQQSPDEAAWRGMRFMVFDLPGHAGPFDERHALLREAIEQARVPWLQVVAQERLSSAAELKARLHQVLAQGGEGLMLHHGRALYQGGRSAQLHKLKPQEDAEARVLAHLPGTGRNAHRLGALAVEWAAEDDPRPRRFRLGSGLGDRERDHPPPVGSVVSFRYRGLTASGLPRHASFWRVRPLE